MDGVFQNSQLLARELCYEQSTNALSWMLTGGLYQTSGLQRTLHHLHIGRSSAQSCSLISPAWRPARRKSSRAARSTSACQAAGVAEAEKAEESEVFRTNDGVIEPVDDDEAEVRDTHSARQDSHSLLQGASCLYRLTFWEKAQVGTCDLYKESSPKALLMY